MKKLILFVGALCLLAQVSLAQDCSKFYPLKNATKFQLTSYDKKDKVTATVDYEVMEVNATETGEKATVKNIIKDDKGEVIVESTVEMTCENEVVSMDFKSMVSPLMYEQYSDMDIELNGTNLEYPNNLAEGDQLADADVQMKLKMSGVNMNMNIKVSDRKVIGKETITTPAGTFDCFIISYNTEMKLGIRQQNSAKQWMAEGVGLVKQVDYKKNGKVLSTTLLTQIIKS